MAVRDLIARFLGDNRDLRAKVQQVATDTGALQSKTDKFAGAANRAFRVVAAGAAAHYAKELFNLGIQGAAMERRFDTVFGGIGEGNREIEALAENLGVATVRMEGMAAGVGQSLINMGLSQQAAYDTSVKVLELADAWDQYTGGQIGAEEITDKLTRGIMGQTRGLIDLKMKITEQDVAARVAANGHAGLTGAALKSAQAQARLQLIMEGSTEALAAYAEGETDAEKAADSAAKAFDELKFTMGEALLQLAPLVETVSDVVSGIASVPGVVGPAAAAILALSGHPVIAATVAIIGFGKALDDAFGGGWSAEDYERMSASQSKMKGTMEGVTGAVKEADLAVQLLAVSAGRASDAFSAGPATIEAFQQALAGVDFSTATERMNLAAADIIGIWDEVDHGIAETAPDVQKAMIDALDMQRAREAFEADAKILVDRGLGELVASIKANPDREEAIALMDHFANNLAEAGTFSEQMGFNITTAWEEVQTQMAGLAGDPRNMIPWIAYGQSIKAGVLQGMGDLSGAITSKIHEDLRRAQLRGGALGLNE